MRNKVFDDNKHWVRFANSVGKQMVDDQGNKITGAIGRSGVIEVADDEGNHIGIDKIELEAGAGFQLHTHPGQHILYVLAGKGILQIDGRRLPMKKGDTFYVPAELPHAMKATENSFMNVLAIGYPH